jgi:hypothetical protein
LPESGRKVLIDKDQVDYYKNLGYEVGKYAKGGETQKTGLHWLDGNPGEPERVLSAEQTKSFNKLVENLIPTNQIMEKVLNVFKVPNFNIPSVSKNNSVGAINNNIAFNIDGSNGISKTDLQKAADYTIKYMNTKLKTNFGIST